MKFDHLFEPIQIGNVTIKNRFVVPAITYSHTDLEHTIAYYEERAKGGYGLIVHDAAAVSKLGASFPGQFNFYDDSFNEEYKRIVDTVHKHDCKMFIQVLHAGRTSMWREQSASPSGVPDPSKDFIPHELTVEEIHAIVEEYGDAAVRAQKIGFDGIEVHAAHGYLIAQFLSPQANKRFDEYGGTIDGRMRFLLEIIDNIKKKTNGTFPLVVRLSVEEDVHGGLTSELTDIITREIDEAGVDCISVSCGNYTDMSRYIASPHFGPGFLQDYAERIKKNVKCPVMVVGRINSPYVAEMIIRDGKADMVCLGRPSVAEAAFPNKVAEGQLEEISPCIGCNQGCFMTRIGLPTSCSINPNSSRESENLLKPTENPKNVMVVGAGPGGLYAAWALAKRGHNVTLYEKTDKLGGQFRIGGIPPVKHEINAALKYYVYQCKKNNVEIVMNTEVTKELIVEKKPDAVVLATGALPLVLPIKGIDTTGVVTAVDLLDGKIGAITGCDVVANISSRKILVCGGGEVGVETAAFLGERGCDVTVMEMKPVIIEEEAAPNRPMVLLSPKVMMMSGVILQRRNLKKSLEQSRIVLR